jgi:site-specific DNA-methyltransferase (adenine-specific)
MSRVEHIGDATLYLGDCRDVIPTLSGVDTVITDPPYGIVNKFGPQNRRDGTRVLQFPYDTLGDNEKIVTNLSDACSLAQSFFVFCGSSQISHIETRLQDRFTVKSAVWIKACPPPAMPGNWWPSGFEYALFGYRQGAPFFDVDTRRSNVFYTDTYRFGIRTEEKVDHPTQKWLPLIKRIVVSVAPADGTVLDLYLGSGTTGVACARLGRKFIGIEIHEPYFDIACRRIEEAYRQPDMFVAQPPPARVNLDLFQKDPAHD